MEILVGAVLFIILFWIIVKVIVSSEKKRAQKQYKSDATGSTTYTATPFFFAGPSESSGDCDSSFGGDGGDGGDGGSCGGD